MFHCHGKCSLPPHHTFQDLPKLTSLIRVAREELGVSESESGVVHAAVITAARLDKEVSVRESLVEATASGSLEALQKALEAAGRVGYNAPEVIQAAYRIGDSVTNLITPMMSYFGLILAVATRYRNDMGIGTLVALMLPYTLFMLIGWSVLFFIWVFILGLPVGPGSATYYTL